MVDSKTLKVSIGAIIKDLDILFIDYLKTKRMQKYAAKINVLKKVCS